MTKSTVLIADDSEDMHRLVRACLEPEPLRVHSAYDGAAALRAAAAVKPKVILLDVNMPGGDGFEVCQRLKADPETSDAAVLFLTREQSESCRSRAFELGALDYINKPFQPEKLRARVRWALRTQHRRERSTLVDGLTGLWNEFYLDEDLAEQLSQARRQGGSLACITAEVSPVARPDEHFDDVAGDEMLRAVAEIILSKCRGNEDTAYYCGNRKFVAILARTNRAGAEHVVQRVRTQVERDFMRDDAGAMVRCTFDVSDTQAQTFLAEFDRAAADRDASAQAPMRARIKVSE